jgi:predicted house-cleaning noncanonical NTP pyrophosphatase (MazG superfamily)
MKIYNKLIRDRIPEIIAKDGNTADIIILSEESFKQAIKEKLIEEATEVLNADNRDEVLSELADLQEVMDTIKQMYNINTLEVNTIQAVKALQRGKFEKRLYLRSVTEKE